MGLLCGPLDYQWDIGSLGQVVVAKKAEHAVADTVEHVVITEHVTVETVEQMIVAVEAAVHVEVSEYMVVAVVDTAEHLTGGSPLHPVCGTWSFQLLRDAQGIQ